MLFSFPAILKRAPAVELRVWYQVCGMMAGRDRSLYFEQTVCLHIRSKRSEILMHNPVVKTDNIEELRAMV